MSARCLPAIWCTLILKCANRSSQRVKRKIATLTIVFPSNCIRLSLYSVFSGCNCVMLLNNDLGINVTGDPLSMINLFGRLLTNAVIVKKSGPLLFTDHVEWIFCFTEWIVFGVQSSSFALLVSSSIIWFTFLLVRQHLAKWPVFPHFAHFFSSGWAFVLS